MELEKEFDFTRPVKPEIHVKINKYKLEKFIKMLKPIALSLGIAVFISSGVAVVVHQLEAKQNYIIQQQQLLAEAKENYIIQQQLLAEEDKANIIKVQKTLEILAIIKEQKQEIENKKTLEIVVKNENEILKRLESEKLLYDNLVVKTMKFTSLAFGNYLDANNELNDNYLKFQKERVQREEDFTLIMNKYKKNNKSLSQDEINLLSEEVENYKFGKVARSSDIEDQIKEFTSPKNFEISSDAQKMKVEVIAEITKILTPGINENTSRKKLKM